MGGGGIFVPRKTIFLTFVVTQLTDDVVFLVLFVASLTDEIIFLTDEDTQLTDDAIFLAFVVAQLTYGVIFLTDEDAQLTDGVAFLVFEMVSDVCKILFSPAKLISPPEGFCPPPDKKPGFARFLTQVQNKS